MPSPSQQSQMARMARIISRIRAAGWDHGMEKRLVMWGLIWEPRPSRKRPSDCTCRSQAVLARVIGLRAKATAMPVPSSSRSVASAARTWGRKGSWLVSALHAPS